MISVIIPTVRPEKAARCIAALNAAFEKWPYEHEIICEEDKFCDRELGDVCKEMGRFVFAEKARLIHDHPLIKGEGWDEHYVRAYKTLYAQDAQTYQRRRHERWMRAASLNETQGQGGVKTLNA